MPVKVTVYLPKPATEALKDLALKRNTTPTEILRHAISLEKELNDELTQGARVLLEKDGDYRELVV